MRRAGLHYFWVSVMALIGCLPIQAQETGVDPTTTVTAEVAGTQVTSVAWVDQPVEEYRAELLDLAFNSASAFPLVPHIKNRSRAQEVVVIAALALGQPVRTTGYVRQIVDWRRGLGYAYLANHAARLGAIQEARAFLRSAELVATARDLEEHRANMVLQSLVDTYATLGDTDKANQVQAQMHDLTPLRAAAMQALRDPSASHEDKMMGLGALLESKNYDSMVFAFERYPELLAVKIKEVEAWPRLLSGMVEGIGSMPIFFQIDQLLKLADLLSSHDQHDQALELVNRAQRLFESAAWELDEWGLRVGQLATSRYLAGDREKALADLQAALTRYVAEMETIFDYERAKSLRSMAEAYARMGQREPALKVYRLAMDQGSLNPNLRPRINDLTALCVSMAVHGIEPDAPLWAQIRKLHAGLHQP